MKQNISNGIIIKDVHGESFPGETFRVLKDRKSGRMESIGRNVWSWGRGGSLIDEKN